MNGSLFDDSGRAHHGRTDPAADGHQRRGIGGRQEDVAGHQGRSGGAPGAEHRENPGAVDDSPGSERLIGGPRRPQGFTGLAAEIDQGDRASLVRQDLADGLLGDVVVGTDNHGLPSGVRGCDVHGETTP